MSVYRARGATPAELWSICERYVDRPEVGRRAKARGTCEASVVMGAGLSFDANGVPHSRHADVIGWPDMKLAKHELKNLQQKIAPMMSLEMRK